MLCCILQVLALSKQNEDKYTDSVRFLRNIITLFHDIQIGNKHVWKPVQTGFILTTTSILELVEMMLDEGYKFVLTSRFTNDNIENLFSQVRANNALPTPVAFKVKIRTICMAQFIKNIRSHRETIEDRGTDTASLVQHQCHQPLAILQKNDMNNENLTSTTITLKHSAQTTSNEEADSVGYIGGYIVSRVLKQSKNCPICKDAAVLNDGTRDKNHLISMKEYKENALMHSSDLLTEFLQILESVFRSVDLKNVHRDTKIHEVLCQLMMMQTASIVLPPCHNLKEKLIKRFAKMRLIIWTRNHKHSFPATNSNALLYNSRSANRSMNRTKLTAREF